VKIYKKIHKFSNVISYFGTHEWKITNKNVQALWEKLDEDDRKLFDFDIGGLDWEKYFYHYVRGVRIFVLKDELSTVPRALAKYKRYVALVKMHLSELSGPPATGCFVAAVLCAYIHVK
jgi:fatty acyl-CoA reductase